MIGSRFHLGEIVKELIAGVLIYLAIWALRMAGKLMTGAYRELVDYALEEMFRLGFDVRCRVDGTEFSE